MGSCFCLRLLDFGCVFFWWLFLAVDCDIITKSIIKVIEEIVLVCVFRLLWFPIWFVFWFLLNDITSFFCQIFLNWRLRWVSWHLCLFLSLLLIRGSSSWFCLSSIFHVIISESSIKVIEEVSSTFISCSSRFFWLFNYFFVLSLLFCLLSFFLDLICFRFRRVILSSLILLLRSLSHLRLFLLFLDLAEFFLLGRVFRVQNLDIGFLWLLIFSMISSVSLIAGCGSGSGRASCFYYGSVCVYYLRRSIARRLRPTTAILL